MREFGVAPILIEEPPEIEFRNGIFYITDEAGYRAMQPIVLLRAFERTAKAIQSCYGVEIDDAKVIPFPIAS